MSVHQESMAAHKAHAHEEVHVENEISRDMITLFLTALIGGIMGTLFTVFVLSLINGGSLRYAGGAKTLDSVVEAHTVLQSNVGQMAENIALQNDQFATDVNTLNEIVTGHSRSINQMAPMVARTNANSRQTSVLMSALEEAFTKTSAVASGDDLMVADLSGDGAADAGPALTLVTSSVSASNLPVGRVTILPFVDADGSGVQDAGELNEVGITASLIDTGDMSAATVVSGGAGFNFHDIAAGSYKFVIENGGAFASLVGQSIPVELGAGDENGQLIYMGIVEPGVEPAAATESGDDADAGDDHAAGDGDAAHADDDDHDEEAGHDDDAAHGDDEDLGEEAGHDEEAEGEDDH